MRLNHVGTRCAIATPHTISVLIKEYSHLSEFKMILDGDEYKILDSILKPYKSNLEPPY